MSSSRPLEYKGILLVCSVMVVGSKLNQSVLKNFIIKLINYWRRFSKLATTTDYNMLENDNLKPKIYNLNIGERCEDDEVYRDLLLEAALTWRCKNMRSVKGRGT